MNSKEKIKFFLKKWKIFINSISDKINCKNELIASVVKVSIIEKILNFMEKSQ
jgi:hypothetical protein